MWFIWEVGSGALKKPRVQYHTTHKTTDCPSKYLHNIPSQNTLSFNLGFSFLHYSLILSFLLLLSAPPLSFISSNVLELCLNKHYWTCRKRVTWINEGSQGGVRIFRSHYKNDFVPRIILLYQLRCQKKQVLRFLFCCYGKSWPKNNVRKKRLF